ncbi:dihydroorotase [Alloscardovia macacae]|uniref:Dihydroorotase n=1 Tax=Alloscardovia macacae TaxID=1160091 RepID=A0A261F5S8_9BIFI|nr:dihydroorotase [Alloscardovia macacae]OZG54497.1 dihydroorotase [Alloscardovia macacae]
MTTIITDIRIWDTGETITVRIPDEHADAERVLDGSAWVIAPGFADPHVHFRDPGQTDKETMATGAAAAAAGGYTSVLIMPNTLPALDGVSYDGMDALEDLENREDLPVRYALCASASKQREGSAASDFEDWKDRLRKGSKHYKHPVVAVSDDGAAVTNSTLESVVQNCLEAHIPFIDHCEHHTTGVMNEGPVSRKLSLPGIPADTELNIVERDIRMARATGVHLHLQHVSTAAAFDAIRRAKDEGVQVTCETAPHYLALNDSAVEEYGTYAKMNPPLRSAADQLATLEAVCDGTVDMIATDHAPHTAEEKGFGALDAMMSAPNGIIGLETAYPVLRQVLVEEGYIDDTRLVEMLSVEPLRLLGAQAFDIAAFARAHDGELDFASPDIHALETHELSQTDIPGQHPDVVILAPSEQWTIDAEKFASKARNTPFDGWHVRGRVVATLCNGQLTHSRLNDYDDKGLTSCEN